MWVLGGGRLQSAADRWPEGADDLAQFVSWLLDHVAPRQAWIDVADGAYRAWTMKGSSPPKNVGEFPGGMVLFVVTRDYAALRILDVIWLHEVVDDWLR